MRGLSVRIAIALVAIAAMAGTAAAASPPTLEGWPRPAPAGTLLPGPGGGVVVVAVIESDGYYLTAAYRRDGRRLWAFGRGSNCGNCIGRGSEPVALQANGTYGPLGSGRPWGVDARGREVAGCSGALLADSTCFTGTSFQVTDWTDPRPGVAVTGTAAPWGVVDVRYRWADEPTGAPQRTVRDGAGLVYAAFRSPADVATRTLQPGLLMVVDPVTRTIVASRLGPVRVLAALPSGVLVSEGQGIAALGPDGAVRWSRSFRAERDTVLVDAARDRVYVQSLANPSACDTAPPSPPDAPPCSPIVRALRASTGATVWRTRTKDNAGLRSLGRGGRVYLATSTAGRRAVRAVRFTNGSTVWQRGSRLPVHGVRELRNGTVAVSVGEDTTDTLAGGRMTVFDPR